jgi:acyl transferase domain-containing protein
MSDAAIVGIGAVFPGAGDAPAFWRNIVAGVDAITEVPPDRWDPGVYYRPGETGDDRFYCRRGGFVDDLAEFDPAQFGIMPNAVHGIEPDQLLVLRAAAEAIADCGTLPDRDRVGVIIGRGGYLTPGVARLDQRVRTAHQLTAVLRDLVPGLSEERIDAVRAAFRERLGSDGAEASIGLVPNFAASRLANRFDLRGPAYTVDAACASSLVAVDHAVSELTSGRCDAVLAGGVHTCHHPTLWSVFTQLRALSSGERIRPFDARADGTLLAEGTGAVLLKRLDDALAAGDRVYAVIRGVGVSSDGRATSMMNPVADGQELAMRRAWAAAGLDPAAPDALGLLEAHGTATPAGDQVELTTLERVFGPPSGAPIGLGTVKSMIGHAMPAAGIAGLIKAAFAVYHGVLPPTLNISEPHPVLARTRFEPVNSTRPWDNGGPRRAAVNAFGFGGINAHVILEAPPEAGPAWRPAAPGPFRSAQPAAKPAAGIAGEAIAGPGGRVGKRGVDIPAEVILRPAEPASERGADIPAEAILRLAAHSPRELAELLAAPDDVLLGRAGEEPGDGPCRLAIVAPGARSLALARKVVARGTPWRGRSDLWFTPRPLLSGPEQVAFLFPGFEPEFAPRVEGVAEAFGLPVPRLRGGGHRGGKPGLNGGRSTGTGLNGGSTGTGPGMNGGSAAADPRDGVVEQALNGGSTGTGPGMNGGSAAADPRDGVVEQALDVIAVSRLFAGALAGLGISPGVVAGHSLGEWTAMMVAGMYPEIDAFIGSMRPGMVEVPDVVYAALGAPADRAAELARSASGVVVSHDNCPHQSVVCGPAGPVGGLVERARAAGIMAQTLPFRTGFHSPMYAPFLAAARETLQRLEVRPGSVPIWSATSLAPFPRDPGQVRDLVLRHLVEPVRFRQLTELLHESGVRAFVQVGPGSLTGFAEDTLRDREHLTVATAVSQRDGLAQLRRAAAALWTDGLCPRFDRLGGPAASADARAARQDTGRAEEGRGRTSEDAGRGTDRPGQPGSRASQGTDPTGQVAGHTDQGTGRPDQAGGRTGQGIGRTGQGTGRPDQAGGRASQGIGRTGQGIGRTGQGIGRTGQGTGRPDQAGGRGSQGIGRTGQAIGRTGQGTVRLRLGGPLVRLAEAVEPLTLEHVASAPVTAQSPITQSVTAQSVTAQPVLGQPVLGQPVTAQPVIAQPVIAQPVMGAAGVDLSPGKPVLAELGALMAETTAAAGLVAQALADPRIAQGQGAGEPRAEQTSAEPGVTHGLAQLPAAGTMTPWPGSRPGDGSDEAGLAPSQGSRPGDGSDESGLAPRQGSPPGDGSADASLAPPPGSPPGDGSAEAGLASLPGSRPGDGRGDVRLAPPPGSRPGDGGGDVRSEEHELTEATEFSLRTMPDIADHCIFPQAEGWPDDCDRFPVVPMTTLLEVMADAALAVAPGCVVTGFEQVTAARWLTVAPATTARVHAARDGEARVRVSIEGYASGRVLVAGAFPVAPSPATAALHGERAAPVSVAELYADRWMFHGPRFAGVADIASLADDGITGTVTSMPARGALLDSAGQLIGHWMQVSRTVDQTVLPTGIRAVRLYGPQPPAGDRLGVVAWIREVTGTEMRADAELRTADGRVWCRIEGWTTRRFATDDAIWRVKFRPESNTLSRTADGWTVLRERWPDTASRELMMRSYLNSAERARYTQLNPLQQRRWLLGAIAVKDAVRRWLWDRGAGPIYPAEITVEDFGAGLLVRGPFRAPRVSLAYRPPDGAGRACAVAVAGEEPVEFTIGSGGDGTLLVTRPGQEAVPIDAAAPVAARTGRGDS